MSMGDDDLKKQFTQQRIAELNSYYDTVQKTSTSTPFLHELLNYTDTLFDGMDMFSIDHFKDAMKQLDNKHNSKMIVQAFERMRDYSDYILRGEPTEFYIQDNNTKAVEFLRAYHKAIEDNKPLEDIYERTDITIIDASSEEVVVSEQILSPNIDKYLLTKFHEWLMVWLEQVRDTNARIDYEKYTITVGDKTIKITGAHQRLLLDEIYNSEDYTADGGGSGLRWETAYDTARSINRKTLKDFGLEVLDTSNSVITLIK